MESTDKIKTLYTDDVIEIIIRNHTSEINAIKNKYDNQIKRIKELHENQIKKFKEEHEKQINEINTLRSSLKLNKKKLTQSMHYQSEYVNIKQRLDGQMRFIGTLRTELNTAVESGKRAWHTFKKYSPKQYDSYIKYRYQGEDES